MIHQLHEKKTITIAVPDTEDRSDICIRDSVGHAMMIIYNMLQSMDLKPKDVMTIDIRVLVEHSEKKGGING